MEKLAFREREQERRVRFLNVANEGKEWFSFVLCQTNTADVIIYAWLDNLAGTTHTAIFDLAVEDFGFNEKYEPIGGGALNIKTCEIQDSIHYGGVDDPNIERAVRHKARCESDF